MMLLHIHGFIGSVTSCSILLNPQLMTIAYVNNNSSYECIEHVSIYFSIECLCKAFCAFKEVWVAHNCTHRSYALGCNSFSFKILRFFCLQYQKSCLLKKPFKYCRRTSLLFEKGAEVRTFNFLAICYRSSALFLAVVRTLMLCGSTDFN